MLIVLIIAAIVALFIAGVLVSILHQDRLKSRNVFHVPPEETGEGLGKRGIIKDYQYESPWIK